MESESLLGRYIPIWDVAGLGLCFLCNSSIELLDVWLDFRIVSDVITMGRYI